MRRFIPACAGNASSLAAQIADQVGSSPRVRGTRVNADRQSRPQSGSSPRVRGTPVLGICAELAWRFIPACAGNARPSILCTALMMHRFIPACAGNAARPGRLAKLIPVHPRVCGERRRTCSSGRSYAGSSPRVRGTQRRTVAERSFDAGSSPRVRGTQHGSMLIARRVAGSSPRVRGTRLGSEHRRQVIRFIPACAGNADA